MRIFLIAAFAVAVLWAGMWSVWTPGFAVGLAMSEGAGTLPIQQGEPMPGGMMGGGMMRGMMNGTAMQSEMGFDAASLLPTAAQYAESGPLITNDSSDFIARLDQVQRQLEAVVTRLEAMETGAPNVEPASQSVIGYAVGAVGLMTSKFLVVLTSGPVVGLLFALLLVMLVAAVRQKSAIPEAQGAQDNEQLPQASKAAPTLSGLLAGQVSTHQVQTYFASLKPQTWPGLARTWISTVPAEKVARIRSEHGEFISDPGQDGQALRAAVFNENEVRAAAGLTLALGTVAFAYAYFAKVYAPIQVVTTLFFIEFLVRITYGLKYSPMGLIARKLTARQTPHWVSAKPKQFAWTLGVFMSLAMMIITNSGIRGTLPLTICLICLTLMWLEAVLGLCLGCEIHRMMVKYGWARKDDAFEICTHGACNIEARA